MGGLKLSVHPLFFALGFYYALTGRIFEFVIYTVTAVIHELGHSFAAANAGYRLNKIILMPFGAVVKGNVDGLKMADEVKIALAGPFINLATGIFFVAAWWIYPECYAFTDVAAAANFSMALVNFIPAFPLDGGRIVSAAVVAKAGKDKAYVVCKIMGLILSAVLIALFAASCFVKPNVSLLTFSVFVLAGTLSRAKDNVYIKMYTALTAERLARGMPYKKQALEKRATVKKMMSMLDENAVNEIVVFDGDKKIAVLSQDKIGKIIEKGEIYSPIGKFTDV